MDKTRQVWITGSCISQTRRGVTLRVLDRTDRTRDVTIARVHIAGQRNNGNYFDFLVPVWVAHHNKLHSKEA